MGREVKRVHIDFDWFERKARETWDGYLLDCIKCPLCKGSGKALNGHYCTVCEGEGEVSPRIDVPKGYDYNDTNGYQIWQNVSEGGPVSPVFLKPEDLAKWMVDNDPSITKDTTYEGWLRMIKEEGSAPSFIGSGGSLGSGVAKVYNKKVV